MKLAVAQIRPGVGMLEHNIDRHIALVNLGVQHLANLIIFPELSLTGYEPSLATQMALSRNDSRLARFQHICDSSNVSVGVGLPLLTNGLPRISTLLFRPGTTPLLYSKRYLHIDEEPFFDCGEDTGSTIYHDPKVALAICYELSIPEHCERAFDSGATVYIASAAKTQRGVEEASQRLSSVAKTYSSIVMLSNCVGMLEGEEYAGHTSVWGRCGTLLDRLDAVSDGVIVVNYQTEETVSDVLAPMGQ